MATITQTVQEFLPKTQVKQIMSPRTKPKLPPKTKQAQPQALGCPPDCSCKVKKEGSYARPMQLLFNLVGIIVALIATYMMVTTDSKVYLIFWVCYSVLRRLSKSRSHAKSD